MHADRSFAGRICAPLGLALALVSGGCVEFERAAVPVPQFLPDQGRLDRGLPDAAAADLAMRPDRVVQDLALTPDLSTQDSQVVDAASPVDLGWDATLDAQLVDAQAADAAVPQDQAVPDLAPDEGPVCVEELCNGLDDDCDGELDEAFELEDDCTVRIGGRRCEVRGVTQCGPAGDVICGVPPGESVAQRDDRIRNCNCDVALNEVNVDQHILCRRQLPWADAAAFCQALGMQLWVVDSVDEWQSVTTSLLLQGGGREIWWVGLSDREIEGRFQWVDGRLAGVGYVEWRAGEPNDWMGGEDCVEVNLGAEGRFNDGNCELDFGFVCEALSAP